MKSLHDLPRYRSFIEARNLALEELREKRRVRIDGIVRSLMDSTMVKTRPWIKQGHTISKIDESIWKSFQEASRLVVVEYLEMRRLAYTLAYVGEAEAIARATGQETKYDLPKDELAKVMGEESFLGGSLEDRISYYFAKLRRRVIDAIQLGMLNEEPSGEIEDRIEAAFPKQVEYTRDRRKLTSQKKLREAINDGLPNAADGLVDDEAWDDLVDEYRKTEIPTRTGERIRFKVGKKTVTKYDWELERDFNNDFVNLVRQGQLDVAKENGYTDFVWISVIDNRTDECCLWRDGLLVSEIEKELKRRKDDPCHTTVPPAHFNCRCDIAPVTDRIKDFDVEPLGDFETWLTNP